MSATKMDFKQLELHFSVNKPGPLLYLLKWKTYSNWLGCDYSELGIQKYVNVHLVTIMYLKILENYIGWLLRGEAFLPVWYLLLI